MSPTNPPSFTLPVATIAADSSVHVAPPSCVTCTLPSSVPTHRTFGSNGLSTKLLISLIASPSLREIRVSRFATPISTTLSRLIDRVRSLLLVQVAP